MDTQILPQKPQNFTCINCRFVSSNKKDYVRHLSTLKHKNRENDTNMIQKNPKKPQTSYECINCYKTYKYSSGLYRHKKKCMDHENGENGENGENLNYQLMLSKELILEVVKQQQNQIKELTNTIKELIPKVGNNITTTNQKFNIQVFLNEKCKDAINMSDFIKSIEVSLQQLDYTKHHGLVNGLSNVIIENMNKLGLYQRPIHCTDIKRESLYIKDDDNWEKDTNKEKIKRVIKNVSTKQFYALSKWTQENPDFQNNENKQNYYTHALVAIANNKEQNEEKIIKKLCSSSYIKE
uniref:C2H2-type domain-containing protein n=1 Tax=viral metagenome TaxID=1070528 RepID=A0A6C0H4D0_9ZZZZ